MGRPKGSPNKNSQSESAKDRARFTVTLPFSRAHLLEIQFRLEVLGKGEDFLNNYICDHLKALQVSLRSEMAGSDFFGEQV